MIVLLKVPLVLAARLPKSSSVCTKKERGQKTAVKAQLPPHPKESSLTSAFVNRRMAKCSACPVNKSYTHCEFICCFLDYLAIKRTLEKRTNLSNITMK